MTDDDKLDNENSIEHISLEFNARWYYIQHVWTFVQNMLAEVLDKKQAELIALSVSELIENSVKYAEKRYIELNIIRIMIEMHNGRNIVVLEVQNFSDPKHIEVLQKEIDRLTSDDPDKLFKEKLMEAATRKDGGSQLGLIRILREAKGRMEMISDRNKVAMRVEFDMVK